MTPPAQRGAPAKTSQPVGRPAGQGGEQAAGTLQVVATLFIELGRGKVELRLIRVVQECHQLVIVALGDRIVLVTVALGASEGES